MKTLLNLFLLAALLVLALVGTAYGIRLYEDNQRAVTKVVNTAAQYAEQAKETVVESYDTVEKAVKK